MSMRVTLGGLQWAWDDKARGECRQCAKPVVPGQQVYRLPRRPWKTSKDPIVHVTCWDQHRVEMEPTMAIVRQLRNRG